jgi:hypothetical protein
VQSANEDYYRDVEWAVDISEAEFLEADLRGIPVHLVRRDPATQFILRREKLMAGGWRGADLGDPLMPHLIQIFLESGKSAEVMVAARRAKNFKNMIAGFRRLQDMGFVD